MTPPNEARTRPQVHYPESDGQPMGETDAHRKEMQNYAIEVLEEFFVADSQVYVSGNNFVYLTEGVPADCVSPDCYVVRGVEKRIRRIFKCWEEGQRPCFVLEVTSRKTRSEDLGSKMSRYRDDLRVPEYFLFDLQADWIPERLRGYRLRDGIYLPIPRQASGRFASHELGMELGVADGHVRFYLPEANGPLPTLREQIAQQAQRTEEERRRTEEERLRADNAEAELTKLRAEIARLRGI